MNSGFGERCHCSDERYARRTGRAGQIGAQGNQDHRMILLVGRWAISAPDRLISTLHKFGINTFPVVLLT